MEAGPGILIDCVHLSGTTYDRGKMQNPVPLFFKSVLGEGKGGAHSSSSPHLTREQSLAGGKPAISNRGLQMTSAREGGSSLQLTAEEQDS